jgi:hypothetical protein
MPRIKIQSVVESLDSKMRSALAAAVREVLPDAQVDRFKLFRAFKRAVGRKCSTWENVRDDYVEKD